MRVRYLAFSEVACTDLCRLCYRVLSAQHLRHYKGLVVLEVLDPHNWNMRLDVCAKFYAAQGFFRSRPAATGVVNKPPNTEYGVRSTTIFNPLISESGIVAGTCARYALLTLYSCGPWRGESRLGACAGPLTPGPLPRASGNLTS